MIARHDQVRPDPCDRCDELDVHFVDFCGAWICGSCDHHQGLARCYCGWAESGGNGRTELLELGEVIDPE